MSEENKPQEEWQKALLCLRLEVKGEIADAIERIIAKAIADRDTKIDTVIKDRDSILTFVQRFVETVDRGDLFREFHWLAADARVLGKVQR